MVIQYITAISGIPLGNVPGFTGDLQALRSDKKGLTPEKLLVLQDHVLNYNVEVSLVGTLARKIVAAVETLTRS